MFRFGNKLFQCLDLIDNNSISFLRVHETIRKIGSLGIPQTLFFLVNVSVNCPEENLYELVFEWDTTLVAIMSCVNDLQKNRRISC